MPRLLLTAGVAFLVSAACAGTTPATCEDGLRNGDELEVDCGGSCGPCTMVVLSIKPTDGEYGVLRDQPVHVTFSRSLDAELPADAVRVVDPAGNAAIGRVLTDGPTLTFLPARFDADTTYQVIVSADVSAGGHVLGRGETFRFHTGGETSDSARIPPEGYDPLGRGRQSAMRPRAEIAIVWNQYPTPEHPPTGSLVVQDPLYDFAAPDRPGTVDAAEALAEARPRLAWANELVAAQLDDDGLDEIAVLSLSDDEDGILQLTVLDPDGSGGLVEHPADADFEEGAVVQLATGDLDGDARDEVVVLTRSDGESLRVTAVGLDPERGSYLADDARFVWGERSVHAQDARLAVGDADRDGRAEVVIVWTVENVDGGSSAYYTVLEHDGARLQDLIRPALLADALNRDVHCHAPYADVALGDVDGDGADEILFGLTEPKFAGTRLVGGFRTQYRCVTWDHLLIADDWSADRPPLSLRVAAPPEGTFVVGDDDAKLDQFWYWDYEIADWTWSRLMRVLHTADLDGDLRDEVVFHNWIFKFGEAGAAGADPAIAPGWPKVLPKDIVDLEYADYSAGPGWPLYTGYLGDLGERHLTRDVRVGDLDGDLAEDLVLLRQDWEGGFWIDHFDLVSLVDGKPVSDPWADPDHHTLVLEHAGDYFGRYGEPRMALPNLDGDSIIVENIGHDVHFGVDTLIAVLAAAPCSAALGQDTSGCVTQFAQGTTSSHSNGFEVNASAGVIVGLKWKPEINIPFFKIKLAEVEAEAHAGVRGSYQHSWAREVSERLQYVAGADNNLVIFKSHVYDRYLYRILSHPDPEQVGQTVSVSLPTAYRTLAVGQDYFNAHTDGRIKVGADVLGTVPGDLSSYPSRAEVLARVAQPGNRLVSMSRALVTSPQGTSNSAGVEIGVTEAEGADWAVGLYQQASVQVCGPDAAGWTPTVCVGGELAFEENYVHAHEWSEDLVFTGQIAGIPEERYAGGMYSVGIYAYETTLFAEGSDQMQNFLVVGYFVE